MTVKFQNTVVKKKNLKVSIEEKPNKSHTEDQESEFIWASPQQHWKLEAMSSNFLGKIICNLEFHTHPSYPLLNCESRIRTFQRKQVFKLVHPLDTFSGSHLRICVTNMRGLF